MTQRTDASGGVLQTYGYDAFGNQTNAVDTDPNPFRYCAEYFDKETKRTYLRARYYSAENGRFNCCDPAQNGLNWYAYCNNNPVSYYDPSGCVAIFGGLLLIAAAAIAM